MSGDNRQPTCEERIPARLASRLSDFAGLSALANIYDAGSLRLALDADGPLPGAGEAARETFEEIAPETLFADELAAWFAAVRDEETDEWPELPDRAVYELRERAMERMDELPLGASRKIVHRIDLSTGGPADWLEIFVDADEPREIERVVYHFADWFDHAERTLSGDEETAAADFARYVLALDA